MQKKMIMKTKGKLMRLLKLKAVVTGIQSVNFQWAPILIVVPQLGQDCFINSMKLAVFGKPI